MNLYDSPLYCQDLKAVCSLALPWEKLDGKTLLISGATGLIGSFLTDVLMCKNQEDISCKVVAITRNPQSAAGRFSRWAGDERLTFLAHDMREPLDGSSLERVDYVLHLASNTHPKQYATDPIGTITINVFGLYELLEFAASRHAERFVFASSNEIYGNNRGDVELFDEAYCGYINCNTMRAGYPESKRCGEALCQAYRAQKNLDVVIPRLTRSYGPTMKMDDTKALSQFIRKALNDEDIVLKSKGEQYYSFTYVADAVSGLLTVMLLGQDGEAYNIADESGDSRLKDLAAAVAETVGRKVVFELPDAVEAAGYSVATKARLDGEKLRQLGWRPRYDLKQGVGRTIGIMKEVQGD